MGKLAAAFVTFALLASCAYARQLLQGPTPPSTECLIGPDGDKFCVAKYHGVPYPGSSGSYAGCVPLAPAYPGKGYNSTAGSCGLMLTEPLPTGPALQYTFTNFTYTPPDTQWGGAAQKAFVAKELCDNSASNTLLKCSNTYQKQTATTTSTTFTQSLALEADFTFKVGGCALCPAEADTTFKITANVGFQEAHTNTDTTTFSSTLEADVASGNCVWEIFSINYLKDFVVDFNANVDATCMQAGAFYNAENAFFNFPCTNFEGWLTTNPNFTATIASIDPYSANANNPQKAHILLAGQTTINFGTTVNKAACNCNDTDCIAKASASALGNAVPSVKINPSALPMGASPAAGTAKPLTNDELACTNCITNTSGGGNKPAVAPGVVG